MELILFALLLLSLVVFLLSWIVGLMLSLSLRNYKKIHFLNIKSDGLMSRNFGKVCADFKFTLKLIRGDFDDVDTALRYQFVALSICFKLMVIAFLGLIVVFTIAAKNYGS